MSHDVINMDTAATKRLANSLILFMVPNYILLLFNFNSTEAAFTFDIKSFDVANLLGVAVAVHTGEGGVDVVLDADVSVDTYLDAAEVAVERDDGAVHDVGIPQVEAGVAEAGMHLGALETLAAVTVVLLAEGYVNLVHLAAIHDDGLRLAFAMAVAAAAILAEEQQRDAPHHGHEANHVFPDVAPEDDVTCRQEQQDADAEADDGASLVLVVEDVDEARHDDKERPPAFKADMNNIHELQGPHNAEGQKGDTANDFTRLFHDFMCFLVDVCSIEWDSSVDW